MKFAVRLVVFLAWTGATCLACSPCGPLPETCSALRVDQVAFIARTVASADGGFEQEIVDWIWGPRPAGLRTTRVHDYSNIHPCSFDFDRQRVPDFQAAQVQLFVIEPDGYLGGYAYSPCSGFTKPLQHAWSRQVLQWTIEGKPALVEVPRWDSGLLNWKDAKRREKFPQHGFVSLRRGSKVWSAEIKSAWNSTVIPDVPPGDYEVILKMDGFPELRKNTHIPPGSCVATPVSVHEVLWPASGRRPN